MNREQIRQWWREQTLQHISPEPTPPTPNLENLPDLVREDNSFIQYDPMAPTGEVVMLPMDLCEEVTGMTPEQVAQEVCRQVSAPVSK